MAHKNADHVQENRWYGYATYPEQKLLEQAMHIQGISQQATAVRKFCVERAEQIVHEFEQVEQHTSTPQDNSSAIQSLLHTVNLQCPNGNFMVVNNVSMSA